MSIMKKKYDISKLNPRKNPYYDEVLIDNASYNQCVKDIQSGNVLSDAVECITEETISNRNGGKAK